MKCYKYTLKLGLLNIISCLICLLLILLVKLINPHYLEIFFNEANILLFFCLYFVWIFVHELLHYIGFIMDKKVNNRNVVMGVLLEKSICYCMCKQLISKRRILISLVMPFLFIGIITLITGIFINDIYLILLSIMNISGCSGDIVMFIFAIKLPNDIKYYDLDDPTSFNIMTDKPINKKPFGLKLISVDDYKEEIIKAKDKKKIRISFFSKIFIALLFLYFIMCLISLTKR